VFPLTVQPALLFDERSMLSEELLFGEEWERRRREGG
jgi:hypothetical protein